MGVILYELVTLKKPFVGEELQSLFNTIINSPPDPLPEDTSAELQPLVSALLIKDKDSRPSIFDVAKMPCIITKIEQFIQEHDCAEEVMPFFDPESIEKRRQLAVARNGQIQREVQEQLEDWAEVMRSEVEIGDHRTSWFSMHWRCTKGESIFAWVLEHTEED